MLSTKLKVLYKQNHILSEEFPFDEYYPLLRNFMTQEINLGAELLSPYRFAVSYGISARKAVRFFLGLADDEDIIQQFYKYQCEECDFTNIIKDEADLLDFKCCGCGFEDHLVKPVYLSEVKLLFKIGEELLADLRNNLKDLPPTELSVIVTSSGGGAYTEVPFSLFEDVANEGGRMISKKSEELQRRIEQFRKALLY